MDLLFQLDSCLHLLFDGRHAVNSVGEVEVYVIDVELLQAHLACFEAVFGGAVDGSSPHHLWPGTAYQCFLCGPIAKLQID